MSGSPPEIVSIIEAIGVGTTGVGIERANVFAVIMKDMRAERCMVRSSWTLDEWCSYIGYERVTDGERVAGGERIEGDSRRWKKVRTRVIC